MKSIYSPKHIAIIMDGNGRWATQNNLPRKEGHKRGANNVRTITQYCASNNIPYLTLYAFSTENWSRPALEVNFLMKLLEQYLKDEMITYQKNNIRFKAIGDIGRFSRSLQDIIKQTEDATKECTTMTQLLALNYGGRDDIVRATKKLITSNQPINETTISQALDTYPTPEIDLLIRTGGEIRVSNFLLWQIAYAEMFFTKTLWPEFSPQELELIIKEFNNRDRKFGGI